MKWLVIALHQIILIITIKDIPSIHVISAAWTLKLVKSVVMIYQQAILRLFIN